MSTINSSLYLIHDLPPPLFPTHTLPVRPQPPTSKGTSSGGSLNFSCGISPFPYQREISMGVPPNNFFGGGTLMEISFWYGKGDIPNENFRLPPLEVHFGIGGCGRTDSAGGAGQE